MKKYLLISKFMKKAAGNKEPLQVRGSGYYNNKVCANKLMTNGRENLVNYLMVLLMPNLIP